MALRYRTTSRRLCVLSFVLASASIGTAVVWAQSPQRIQAIELVKKAATAYGQGNFGGVINYCQQAIKADASYPRSYTWLGAAYQRRGNKANACNAYGKVVRLAPKTDDARRAIRGLNELGCPVPQANPSVGRVVPLQVRLNKRWNTANSAGVTGLAFSTNGQFLTGSGTSGAWYLWRTADGGLGKLQPGIGGESGAVAASRDFYAVGTGTGSIRLYDARDGAEAREAGKLDSNNGVVTGLAYSKDGRYLASAGAERALKIYDGRENQLLNKIQDPTLDVIAVAFSPDGRLVAASFGGEIRIFGTERGNLVRTLRGDTLPVMSLAWSRDGQYLAAGSGYVIRVWNPNNGQLRRVLTGNRLSVSALSFGTGPILASGSADAQVRLWNAASGANLANLRLHIYPVRAVSFDATGKWLASGDLSGQVGLWRLP